VSDVALLTNQLRYEQKSFWRNPASALFTFAWPVAFSVANACFANLAVSTCMRRDRGQLKAIRGTPLPSWAYLGGASCIKSSSVWLSP